MNPSGESPKHWTRRLWDTTSNAVESVLKIIAEMGVLKRKTAVTMSGTLINLSQKCLITFQNPLRARREIDRAEVRSQLRTGGREEEVWGADSPRAMCHTHFLDTSPEMGGVTPWGRERWLLDIFPTWASPRRSIPSSALLVSSRPLSLFPPVSIYVAFIKHPIATT